MMLGYEADPALVLTSEKDVKSCGLTKMSCNYAPIGQSSTKAYLSGRIPAVNHSLAVRRPSSVRYTR